MLKRALFASSVLACLVTSTTLVRAQNSLTISDALNLPDGTNSTTLDVTLTSSQIRHAFSLAISYDDALVTLSSIDFTGTATANADWSEGIICNDIGDSGGMCTSDGGVIWSVVMGLNSVGGSFDSNAAIPVGTNVVARLNFDTSAMSAPQSTDVDFQNGLNLFGVPADNAVVHETTALSSPALLLNNGEISIAAGVALFRRCDHDGSGDVDLTDPLNLLTHLFLGGFAPICNDASDCDNSGDTDITDGVIGLTFLFLGTVTIPAPGTKDCGPDPSTIVPGGGGLPEQPAVTLGCDNYNACP